MSNPDPSEVLARFAAELSFEHLPVGLLATLKRMVYDTLGTAMAGTTLGSGCRELIDLALEWGGAPDSSIFGRSERVPASVAALVNGATAHALNFDDVFPGGGHLTAVTLPAALAVAERAGNVSGKELLCGVAAGAEVMARLQRAVREDGRTEARPQPTQMLGAFAAAVSAARVLRLDTSRTSSAMGLALMQANGSRQPVLQGTPAKALYAGFPNQSGVVSALLAKRGVEAQCDAFEGEAGLFPTTYRDSYDRVTLLDGLGDVFAASEVGFKRWPTTNRAHGFIEAAQRLVAAHRPDWDAVHRVVLIGGPHLRAFCEPLATRRHPSGWVEAEDSVPFCVAKALINGDVVLADFTPEGLRQAGVGRLADRIEYRLDPDLGEAAVVEVALGGGERISQRIDQPLGHVDRPLSDDALRAKFFDCASHAACPIARATLERVLDSIDRLENVVDVSLLVDLVAARGE